MNPRRGHRPEPGHLTPPSAGRRRQGRPVPARQVVGLAWYEPGEWLRLRELAADLDALDDTYEQWLASARRTLNELRERGVAVTLVAVDVAAAADWSSGRGKPFNSASRAAFAVECLRAGTARIVTEGGRPADPREGHAGGEQDVAGAVRGQRRRGHRR